jgi:hypothetical protein
MKEENEGEVEIRISQSEIRKEEGKRSPSNAQRSTSKLERSEMGEFEMMKG